MLLSKKNTLGAAIALATLVTTTGVAQAETTYKVGGYVQMDTIFDQQNDGGNAAALVRLSGDQDAHEEGEVKFTSLNSRVKLSTVNNDTELGQIKSTIEAHFFGAGTLAIRHAYFQTGNMTFGRTWSTFMDLGALPEKGDFGGSAARAFSRKSLVRYSTDVAGGKLDLALEQPIASIDGEADAATPDVIVKYTAKTGFGHISAGTLIQNVNYEDGTTAESSIAVAARVSGRINVGQDNLKFAVIAGDGLGGYMNFGDTVTGTLDANNKIALSQTVATRVSFQHFWSSKLRSTLVYGKTTSEINNVDADDYESKHLNLIYSPAKMVKFGGEIINASKGDSNLNRVQLFAKYAF